MEQPLAERKCEACEGGVPPLTGEDIARFRGQIAPEWKVIDEKKLRREFSFADFVAAMAFANRVGELAEEEGHHPEMIIGWGKVIIELWTHKIGGLWDNDFILAAKIDQLKT